MSTAHIVLAHPEPRSYSGHLARTAQVAFEARGWQVTRSDLYAMGFDPVEGPAHFPGRKHAQRFEAAAEQRHAFETGRLAAAVRDEIDRLQAADLVMLQYPLWWYAGPAILKGWFDRVLAYGAVYTSQERFESGRFRGRRALVSVVGGGETESFVLGGRNGDVRQSLWPVQFSLHYVGFRVLEPLVVLGVGGWSPDEEDPAESERLARHAEAVTAAVQRIESRPAVDFNSQKDWTSTGAPLPGREDPGPFVYRPGADPRRLS